MKPSMSAQDKQGHLNILRDILSALALDNFDALASQIRGAWKAVVLIVHENRPSPTLKIGPFVAEMAHNNLWRVCP
jgi:hypothetical protein